VGPNDVELVRVFSKEKSADIADITFAIDDDFDLVVEAEAGEAIHSAGAQFRLFLVLRDVTLNDNVLPVNPKAGTNTPPLETPANMTSSAWPSQPRKFEYTVRAAAVAGRANHVCQAIAFLTVGAAGKRDASFGKSPYFMLTD
jgi:hypothetical protein